MRGVLTSCPYLLHQPDSVEEMDCLAQIAALCNIDKPLLKDRFMRSILRVACMTAIEQDLALEVTPPLSYRTTE